MFNEQEYLENLDKIVEENPEVIIGLNNVAQIRWAKKHPATRVFADIFLYTANRMAYEALKEELPNLVGSYEKSQGNVDEAFKVPLFISRVCLRHHGLGQSCKGCTKNNNFHLTQNGKHYNVSCKNCITIMTEQ
jgi:U32 family peptidase